MERIGIRSVLKPTLETLSEILQAHITSIPFENIDVILQRTISLELTDLVNKILLNKRGGYCFEINTLLLEFLSRIGFEMSCHGGRVLFGRKNNQERPRTHMVLFVYIQNSYYLIDATFGALGLTQPLKIPEHGGVTESENLRISNIESQQFLLQSCIEGKWTDLYVFDEFPMLPIDRRVANFYTSNYPESPFRNSLVAMIAGNRGFPSTIVQNLNCIQSDGSSQNASQISSSIALRTLLQERLKIQISKNESEQIFDKIRAT